MTDPEITVVIPTIPPRKELLRRAVDSVWAQTLRPYDVLVPKDIHHRGAAATRQLGLEHVKSDWVAFLDDDDELMLNHLKVLAAAARIFNADYVFSYFMVKDGTGRERPEIDPLGHFGRAFDPDQPTQTTITTLVRTELAQAVGFREPPPGALINGETYGEDFQFTVECVKAGAKIVHVPRRTWWWHHHAGNTSGRPDRW
ncbi:glycosyltransferase family 2 protein [Amycolatopsis thailandensis]|uniref:glycosyltransferase family 2 protein n=1 Tax=Amycolatopsis thailandensis TaxID=589330 RepID=UPI00365DE2EE